MALFWSLFTGGSFLVDFLENEIVLFTGGSFLVDFLENEIVGFDENLTVAL